MNQHENKKIPFRILVMITAPKLAAKAEKLLNASEIPVHYVFNGMGTASSEMLDILGLGTPDKSILVTALPKNYADMVMRKMYKDLRFGTPGSGIAFTLPVSSATNHVIRMIEKLGSDSENTAERKEVSVMSDIKHVMIAAVVNHGFSEEVMNAAREAGAGGGTVLHSRSAGLENVMSVWGLGVQEERELVLIVADTESKLNIMQAISSKCGIHSEAKGMVVSLPIDGVIGLGEVE